MPLAFVCDFDGTVAPVDVGAALVARFGTRDGAGLGAALRRWREGAIGHRELTLVECATLRVTESAARSFTASFALDPAFAPFVREAGRHGHVVTVASEGFGFYVEALLRRAGLGGLPFTANRLRFEGDRVVPEFPHPGGCGRCGNCKGERVVDQRRLGREVVLVGDGLSDRCGALRADHVLARGDLLAWCRAEGIAAAPFGTFVDVAAWARDRARSRAASPEG